MTIGHSGSAGHQGISNTTKAVCDRFIWMDVKDDIQKFCKACLHCTVARNETVPRVLGSAYRAERPNHVLHFDFMYIGKAASMTYVLVLKDGFSGYCELIPSNGADHIIVATALPN